MPKLTKTDIQFIKDNVEKLTNAQMAEILHCDRHTISNHRKRLGISFSDLHDFSQYDQYIINNYNLKTSKALAEQIGCSKSYVTKVWSKAGFKGKINYTYYCNYHYFDHIDTENKAYIIGLLASDGCLYKRENHLGLWQISLQENDIQILKDIKKEIKAEHPIKIIPSKKERTKNSCVLSINSDQMYNNLLRIGLMDNKTWKLNLEELMTNIPKIYWKDFVRGYIDGDGTIVNSNKTTITSSHVSIAMPETTGKQLVKILDSIGIKCGFGLSTIEGKYSNNFGQVYCKNTAEKYCLLKWIYSFNTEKTLSLKRKQKNALNIINNIENNITNRKENIIAVKKWGELLEGWNANQQPSQSNS